jgi:hypothetical protein
MSLPLSEAKRRRRESVHINPRRLILAGSKGRVERSAGQTSFQVNIYVVLEELVPEAKREQHSDWPTISGMVGFAVMMSLDVALG